MTNNIQGGFPSHSLASLATNASRYSNRTPTRPHLPPHRFRLSVIVFTVIAVVLLLSGIVMTILGNWPGYYNGNLYEPLKIVGPIALVLGIVSVLVIAVASCKTSMYEKALTEKRTYNSTIISSQNTLRSNPEISYYSTPNKHKPKSILKSSNSTLNSQSDFKRMNNSFGSDSCDSNRSVTFGVSALPDPYHNQSSLYNLHKAPSQSSQNSYDNAYFKAANYLSNQPKKKPSFFTKFMNRDREQYPLKTINTVSSNIANENNSEYSNPAFDTSLDDIQVLRYVDADINVSQHQRNNSTNTQSQRSQHHNDQHRYQISQPHDYSEPYSSSLHSYESPPTTRQTRI
ncbi:hypothetical protein A3Q56_03103 [Intoshia linei]|uniref:Transmembrane protein n=1 Tax=Intoshia linei TaxID=1819745 RepID=A0A177B4W8_9BILA|nr:hypothetical protein A3Q56_03103 [Intoshia linei]